MCLILTFTEWAFCSHFFFLADIPLPFPTVMQTRLCIQSYWILYCIEYQICQSILFIRLQSKVSAFVRKRNNTPFCSALLGSPFIFCPGVKVCAFLLILMSRLVKTLSGKPSDWLPCFCWGWSRIDSGWYHS